VTHRTHGGAEWDKVEKIRSRDYDWMTIIHRVSSRLVYSRVVQSAVRTVVCEVHPQADLHVSPCAVQTGRAVEVVISRNEVGGHVPAHEAVPRGIGIEGPG
jgi:hypothetical protein